MPTIEAAEIKLVSSKVRTHSDKTVRILTGKEIKGWSNTKR